MTRTPKKPRSRTPYQAATVKAIKAFCLMPRREAWMTAEPYTDLAVTAHVLPPHLTALDDGGNVLVWWFPKRLAWPKDGKKDGPENWLDYTKVEETRRSNIAFGVFLDWCDEHGLKYEAAKNATIPGAKYARRMNLWGTHFRVTIPRQER